MINPMGATPTNVDKNSIETNSAEKAQSSTLLLTRLQDKTLHLILNRGTAKNSLNAALIQAFHQVLDEAEHNLGIRCIAIWGNANHFCTGMDFEEATHIQSTQTLEDSENWNRHYMRLLRRLSMLPKATIACVDGVVMAGGMGIVAACDIVLATEKTRFSLSEALWGLLPSMVLPYLIRRTGFQPAYRLTMTTETLSAQDAEKLHLVDKVTDDLEKALKQYQTRIYRVSEATLQDLKRYMAHLHPITENTENRAVAETARLAHEPRVKQAIENFVRHQQFPWES